MQTKLFSVKPTHSHHQPLEWIKTLKFPPQSGQLLNGKLVGEHILPFQEDIIKQALTPQGKPNKSIFLGYTRKISKSYLFSWIFVYLLEHWPGCSIICMASTYSQSDIVFQAIKNMIIFGPDHLKKKYKFLQDEIKNKTNQAVLKKIFNSPTANLGLMNVQALIADELSAYKDRKILIASQRVCPYP